MPLDNPRFRESYERLFGVGVTIGESVDRLTLVTLGDSLPCGRGQQEANFDRI